MNGPRIQYVYVERRVPARRRRRIMVPNWISAIAIAVYVERRVPARRRRIMVPNWLSAVAIAAAILWSIYYVVNT